MTDEKKLEFQNSTKFGALRELSAMWHFMKQGFTVSIPNMSVRYDFIAEKHPCYLRVQVKNLILKKAKTENESSYDVWCVRPYSMAYGKKRPYDINDCDVIIGISLKTEDSPENFAIIPINEVKGRAAEYRLSEHENSNGKDYLNTYEAIK